MTLIYYGGSSTYMRRIYRVGPLLVKVRAFGGVFPTRKQIIFDLWLEPRRVGVPFKGRAVSVGLVAESI
jgi:hypothetical protein